MCEIEMLLVDLVFPFQAVKSRNPDVKPRHSCHAYEQTFIFPFLKGWRWILLVPRRFNQENGNSYIYILCVCVVLFFLVFSHNLFRYIFNTLVLLTVLIWIFNVCKWSKWKLLCALFIRWWRVAETVGSPFIPHTHAHRHAHICCFYCCTGSVVFYPLNW